MGGSLAGVAERMSSSKNSSTIRERMKSRIAGCFGSISGRHLEPLFKLAASRPKPCAERRNFEATSDKTTLVELHEQVGGVHQEHVLARGVSLQAPCEAATSEQRQLDVRHARLDRVAACEQPLQRVLVNRSS